MAALYAADLHFLPHHQRVLGERLQDQVLLCDAGLKLGILGPMRGLVGGFADGEDLLNDVLLGTDGVEERGEFGSHLLAVGVGSGEFLEGVEAWGRPLLGLILKDVQSLVF